MSFSVQLYDDDADVALSRHEVEAIRAGTSSMPDLDAAEALVDSVAGVMVSVATGGPEIKKVNATYQREHRALAAALKRLGIDYPNRFNDLWRWHGRWSDGSMPTYRDRRAHIAELIEPVRRALAQREESGRALAQGITEGPTGWPLVDQQCGRLRQLWRGASGSDAYNAVGLQAVKILTTVGHIVFDPARDIQPGEEEPGPDDAKRRIAGFLRRVAPGERGENLRKMLNGAYGEANAAKHRHLATRVDAGTAANAVLLIVDTLRLLADESETGETSRSRTPQIPF